MVAIRFLTEEWAQAMTEALNSSDEFKQAAAGKEAKLQQVVNDAPDSGEVKYYFKLEGGRAQVALGELSDAEATISQNYETAVALNKQELNPTNAFMQGKIKIQGNMMKLMQLQSVISTMANAVDHVEVEY
jgi:putative sterol carrier protein